MSATLARPPVLSGASDTAVFAACAAFAAADQHYEAVVNETVEWEPEHNPDPFDVQHDASEIMKARAEELAALTPATLTGQAARAVCALRACARYVPGDPQECLRYVPGELLLAILRDLAAHADHGSPVDPDAALLADCAAFLELERQVHAVRGDEPEHEDERDRLYDLQTPIVGKIVAATAATFAGHQARARCLVSWGDYLSEGSGDIGQRVLHALLRDLIGEGGA